MADPIIILTYIAIIFLFGIIVSIISRKLKISNMLLLLLIGIALNKFQFNHAPLIEFPPLFLTSIGIMALALIVFDASSRFKFTEFDTLSFRALKLIFMFLVLNAVLLTVFTMKIFSITSVHLAVLFATLMAGTAPDVMLTMFEGSKNRVMKLLEVESLLNTPLIVLIPFIILDLLEGAFTNVGGTTFFIQQLGPFLQQLVVGLGAGMLIGIIVFKLMRSRYSEHLSPLALLTTAILTYVLAENLGGNGVLAVTVLGLFFGTVYIKEKHRLQEFSGFFANGLEILVFVMIGLTVNFPFTPAFLAKSGGVFVSLLFIRFLAIQLSFRAYDYNFKEKIFMALNAEKGIAVAAIAFSLGTLTLSESVNAAELTTVLQLIVSFILYSIILSTLVNRFSKYFIGETVKI